MQTPVQVTFRDVPHSSTIENLIQKKAAELERFHDRITSCRVSISAPHRHKRTSGSYYHVTLELSVPGAELVVGREPTQTSTHNDLQASIRDAFRAAKRQLRDHVRRIRHDVKATVAPPHGRVLRVVPYLDYGFIETPEGDEVYFHRNAVHHDAFDKLEAGDEVRFSVETDERGLHATSVTVTSRHLASRDAVI